MERMITTAMTTIISREYRTLVFFDERALVRDGALVGRVLLLLLILDPLTLAPDRSNRAKLHE
jgi:hypothetical protein